MSVGDERQCSAQHSIQDDAEAIDVAAPCPDRVSLAADLFRGHVAGRARSSARGQHPGVMLTERETEIDEDRTSIVGQDHVGRLDVTMHHSLRVRVREGIGNGGDGLCRFPEIFGRRFFRCESRLVPESSADTM